MRDPTTTTENNTKPWDPWAAGQESSAPRPTALARPGRGSTGHVSGQNVAPAASAPGPGGQDTLTGGPCGRCAGQAAPAAHDTERCL